MPRWLEEARITADPLCPSCRRMWSCRDHGWANEHWLARFRTSFVRSPFRHGEPPVGEPAWYAGLWGGR